MSTPLNISSMGTVGFESHRSKKGVMRSLKPACLSLPATLPDIVAPTNANAVDSFAQERMSRVYCTLYHRSIGRFGAIRRQTSSVDRKSCSMRRASRADWFHRAFAENAQGSRTEIYEARA
jgi:hypothetical protein